MIATEDTYASPQYFEALQAAEIVDRSRVKVVVRPPTEGRTAPAHLIAALDEYKDGIHPTLDEDEYWLVFEGCVKELRQTIGAYRKDKLDETRYTRASVTAAVERAKAKDSGGPWPGNVETHVHRLVGTIVRRNES